MQKLNTKPEPIEVDLARSAVVVVDMQNAFAKKGGSLDLAGVDIAGANRVVRTIRDILDSARCAGVLIIYVQMGYKPDLSNAGGMQSPNYHKELAMHLMKRRPELKGELLTEGTWDFAIVDELRPQAGHRRAEDALQRFRGHHTGFAVAEPGYPISLLCWNRYECVRGINSSRRIFSRLLADPGD